MRNTVGFKSIVLIITLIFQNVKNSHSQWIETNGPYAVYRVTGITADVNHLYFGAFRGGVFVSQNSERWNNTSWPSSFWFVSFLRNIEGRLFAGTWPSGLFYSDDFGENWITVNSGNMNSTVRAMIKYNGNLFAGLDLDGVFISKDNGEDWEQRNSGLTETSVMSLAEVGGTIYAGTRQGVFKFDQSTESWTSIGGPNNVSALLEHGSCLIAGSLGFVYNCTDGSWTAINNAYNDNWVNCFAVSNERIYAGTESGGVIFSEDDGMTWNAMNEGLTDMNILSILTNGSELFTGTEYGGVFRFDNDQKEWKNFTSGASGVSVIAFAADQRYLYAGSESNGIFKIENESLNWIQSNSGLTCMNVRSLAVQNDVLYAGTSPDGLFMSNDNGEQWEPINTGLSDESMIINDLAVNGVNLFAATQNGVFMFIKSGKRWVETTAFLTSKTVSSLVVQGDKLFAGTADGIFVQNNSDKSWVKVSAGLNNITVRDMVVAGSNIVALTDDGLFLSGNNGNSWEHVTPGLDDVTLLASHGQYLFAATTHWGVYMSYDNGRNWQPISFTASLEQVRSLAVHGGYLFAGIMNGPVWRRSVSDVLSAVSDDKIKVSSGNIVLQAFPNPFNCMTTISFHVPLKTFVSIDVINSAGRQIDRIMERDVSSGDHAIIWNAKDMPSGIYLIRLRAEHLQFNEKILLIR